MDAIFMDVPMLSVDVTHASSVGGRLVRNQLLKFLGIDEPTTYNKRTLYLPSSWACNFL